MISINYQLQNDKRVKFLWKVSGAGNATKFVEISTFSDACRASSGRGFFFSFAHNFASTIFRCESLPSSSIFFTFLNTRVQITRMILSFDTHDDSSCFMAVHSQIVFLSPLLYPPSLINYQESPSVSGWHKETHKQISSQMQCNLAMQMQWKTRFPAERSFASEPRATEKKCNLI